FMVYFRLDQNVYSTTYVNKPINAYIAASIVVNKSRSMPITLRVMPIFLTISNEKFPVTVRRWLVHRISLSKSTAYHLSSTSTPATMAVLPSIVNKNTSPCVENDVRVK